jgi:hypothetical protein
MTQITSITLPDNVETIDGYAFYGTQGITELTLPKTLTSIGIATFYDCPKLADICYDGTESAWDRVEIGIQNTHLDSVEIKFNNENIKSSTPQILVSDIMGGKKAEIVGAEANAKIYYTTNGDIPTVESELYYGYISFEKQADIIIKAIAATPGYDISDVHASVYAFCRRFLPQKVIEIKDVCELINNVGKADELLLQDKKFLQVLKAVAYKYVKESKTPCKI